MDDPFLIICSACGSKNQLDADLCTSCGADLLTGKVVDASVTETEAIVLRPPAAETPAPEINPATSPLVHDERASDMRRRLTRTFSKTRRLESAISNALDAGVASLTDEPLIPEAALGDESDVVRRLVERINNYFKSEKIRELVTTICVSMTKPLQQQFSDIIRTEVLDRLDEHVARSIGRHITESGGSIDTTAVRSIVRDMLDEENVLRSMDALDFVQQDKLTDAVEKEIRSQIDGLVTEAVSKALPGIGDGAPSDVARRPEAELRLQAEIRRLEDKIERKVPGTERIVRETLSGEPGDEKRAAAVRVPGNLAEEIQQTFLDMHASEETWQLLERKMREVSLDLYSDMMDGVHDYLLDKITSYTDGMTSQAGEMIRAEIAARLPGVLAGFLNTHQFRARLRDVIQAEKAGMDASGMAAIRGELMYEIQTALGSQDFRNSLEDTVFSEGSEGVIIPMHVSGPEERARAVLESPEFQLMLRSAVQNEVVQLGGGSPADAENVRLTVLDYIGSPEFRETVSALIREVAGVQISEQAGPRTEEENQELANVLIGKVEELLPAYLERQFSSENFQAYIADLVAHSMNMPAQDYQDPSDPPKAPGDDFFSQPSQ